jgi:hypothetical protein
MLISHEISYIIRGGNYPESLYAARSIWNSQSLSHKTTLINFRKKIEEKWWEHEI